MPRKPKAEKITEDFDLDFNLPDDDQDDGETGPLDPLFNNYYTPQPPDDQDAPEDETFIKATEKETAEMLADLEHADEHQKSVLGEARRAGSSGVDSNYFFSVVFVSEDQLKAFFAASGWDKYGGTRFLNGVMMAQEMGIELPDSYLATDAKPDKSMAEFIKKGDQANGKRSKGSK